MNKNSKKVVEDVEVKETAYNAEVGEVAEVVSDTSYSIAVQSRTIDVNGHEGFQYTEKGKDGQIVTKTVYEPSVVSLYKKVDYLTQIMDVSRKALAIELGHMDLESIKKAGIKGGFNGFITKCLGKSLDTNTAGGYRRVGRVFGHSYIDDKGQVQYLWHEPISQDVPVTHLRQVLSLVDLPKEWESMTDNEIAEKYRAFAEKYLYTGQISLDCTLKEIREQIKSVNGIVAEVTPTEVSREQAGEQAGEQVGEQAGEQARENALLAIGTLYGYFEGNEKVLALLAEVAEALQNENA